MIKDLMEKELERLLNILSTKEPNSDEYKAALKAVDDLSKQCSESERNILEREKFESDQIETEKKNEIEKEKLKLERERLRFDRASSAQNDETTRMDIDEKKKSRIWGAIQDAFTCVVPLACYGIWWTMGLKFEETGNLNSKSANALMSLIKPKK